MTGQFYALLPLLPAPCSLLPTPYSLLPIPFSLFPFPSGKNRY
ncbi:MULTISPECIES: hypothetical protein [unclassified Moorena]|nr:MULTISPECIES: hypothetical protein [unclassified Moorena]